MESGM